MTLEAAPSHGNNIVNKKKRERVAYTATVYFYILNITFADSKRKKGRAYQIMPRIAKPSSISRHSIGNLKSAHSKYFKRDYGYQSHFRKNHW